MLVMHKLQCACTERGRGGKKGMHSRERKMVCTEGGMLCDDDDNADGRTGESGER